MTIWLCACMYLHCSTVNFCQRYHEFDPMLTSPLPSNPWVSNDNTLWTIEKSLWANFVPLAVTYMYVDLSLSLFSLPLSFSSLSLSSLSLSPSLPSLVLRTPQSAKLRSGRVPSRTYSPMSLEDSNLRSSARISFAWRMFGSGRLVVTSSPFPSWLWRDLSN